MPFTVSHAAAVLPLRRTGLLWSALIIGSFGPDFEYFLRMNFDSRAWHYYPDVLLYCFPFTLLAFFLFHLFVRRPMAGLLPLSFQRRLNLAISPLPRTMQQFLLLCGSLLLGIATHLLWDDFTHSGGWPARHIGLLAHTIYYRNGAPIHGYEVAQLLSSIGGLIILGIWIAIWYRHTEPAFPAISNLGAATKWATWVAIAVVSLGGALWRCNDILGPVADTYTSSLFPLLFVIASIAWFLWQILAYGIAVTLWQKRKGAHR